MKKYYIKLGNNKYVSRDITNRFTCTSHLDNAIIYDEDQKDKLINIMNSLPKSIRTGTACISYYEDYTKGKLECNDIYECECSNHDEEIKETLIPDENEYDKYIEDLKTEISSISSYFKHIIDDKDSLLSQLSNVDSKISDVMHYIEFYKFSASEGYMLCKMIQELRDERRIIKNKIDIIEIFKTQNGNTMASGKTLELINNVDNKKYKPRVLKYLFKDKDHRKRKSC